MTKAKLIRKNAVISQYKAGKGMREIAKKYGLAMKTVQEYLRDFRMKEAEEAARKREERSASITKDIKAGGDRHEVAEKYDVSYQTVNDTVRRDITEQIPTDMLYKLIMCPAQHKSVIRRWAKKLPRKSIKTPEGIMTVLNAYPNILECAKQNKNGYLVTTFTLGEVYYINQGGQKWEE